MSARHVRRVMTVLAAAAAVIAGANAAASAQALAPRAPGEKAPLSALERLPSTSRVVVKFSEGTAARLRSGRLTGIAPAEAAKFAAILSASGISPSAMRRLHARSEAELDAERAEGQRESGRQLADLNLYYVIDLPAGVRAARLADRLNRLAVVEFAEPAPLPPPPPVDIAPRTPSFVDDQTYRADPPGGVGALDPRRYDGGDGAAMRVADVEYSWRLDHEDLEIPNSRIILGGATQLDPFSDRNHGTAVLGEIVGKRNRYGVTGIASGAEAWVAPANTTQNGYDPARAIGLAAGQLRRGDVMVIEQQYWACGFTTGNAYGPLEWLQSVFDAISAATAKGVIVVAAAGNGGLNLDAAGCRNRFNRARRDSGAIIVGAGSAGGRARLSFSSYGSRVDVQGWGEDVTTLGYGDAFSPSERQYYTFSFSGTSSATPIVSGAVLAIQGVLKACGNNALRPGQMRNLLVSTGSAQTGDLTRKIGPLPRIRAALLRTAAEDCVRAQDP